MSQIKFKNPCSTMGRNGISKQLGIDIYPSSRLNGNNLPFEILILNPVNSYGQLTNAWLEIPVEDIPEVIKHLQYFYDQSNNSTTTPAVQRQSRSKSKST